MPARYTLITPDYFVGKALIPELVDLVQPMSAMGEALQSSSQAQIYTYIEQYQFKYLAEMFGEDFASAFIEGATSVNEPANLSLFLEAHRRLFRSQGSVNVSPIAFYIYYYYMRGAKTTSTVYGEVDIDFTYGRNAQNEIKLMDAWNEMVDLGISVYLWANSSIADFRQAGYTHKFNRNLVTKINRFGL